MRSLEILLSLANLLTLFGLVAGQARNARWMRFTAFVALLIAAAQVLIEGPRWQLGPAYAMSGFFFLASLRQRRTPSRSAAGRSRLQRLLPGAAAASVALVYVCSAALPMLVPVFRFPPPSGPYGIGTVTHHLIDASRPEVFATNPSVVRQLMMQIWYPADINPSAPRAAYIPDADAVTTAFTRIHHLPAFILGHVKYVTTNAVVSAPAVRDQARFPVLLFLEGATGYRQMNTFQVEELVSQGYIVAAIDQPGAAAEVVFPDGHAILGLTVAQSQAAVAPSYLPDKVAPLFNGKALEGGSIIPYLAADVIFSLDQLAVLNGADPNRILTGRLDLERVGIFGVSLGGIVAGEACRLEPRLRACLMMDAPMPTTVVKSGLQQPGMWITRDAATMRLERQRSGGWPEVEIDAHQTTMRSVYESLPGAGYFVRVPGMFHSNFTDVPNWSSLLPILGITGPIDGQRAHRIINAYSLAFFDRHLKRCPVSLLVESAAPLPEVLFETRGRALDAESTTAITGQAPPSARSLSLKCPETTASARVR